jgi:hypothetical protein
MSSRSFVVLALFSAGCEPAPACAPCGEFTGRYEGEHEGTLQIAVLETSTPDRVAVEMVFEELELWGEGEMEVADGELAMELRDADGESAGWLSGSLTEGQWSLATVGWRGNAKGGTYRSGL